MKQIIIIDARADFLSDISTYLLLNDDYNYEVLTTFSDTKDIQVAIKKFNPNFVVISENLLKDFDATSINVPVITYVINPQNLNEISNKNKTICLGYINKVNALLETLEKFCNNPSPFINKSQSQPKEQDIPLKHSTTPIVEPPQINVASETTYARENTSNPVISSPSIAQTIYENPIIPNSNSSVLAKNVNERNSLDSLSRLATDLSPSQKKKTTVTTVYAAKGGVGKTTISSNLAVQLSMINPGRKTRYKTCLIDFNIDFGDVLTTLGLNEAGKNMMHWAQDIRARIDEGEIPEKINYTSNEIESFLQVYTKTGLFALLAPIAHEDSMYIKDDQLEVMLRNIIQNGDFDFVVCDTGNNTRDSAVLALDYADYIYLVITQDLTTANCNDAFLSTMSKINFDLSKIKLIINNILPEKQTGISIGDIEKSFSYPCIAKIRHDTNIIRANNFSDPIVFDQNNLFTKEIRKIVLNLTGFDSVEMPKQSIFDKVKSIFK